MKKKWNQLKKKPMNKSKMLINSSNQPSSKKMKLKRKRNLKKN